MTRVKPQDLISQTGDLPTLPSVACRINQEMKNEALTAKMLAAIIEDDTALAAKVLRLANSAFYGLQKQVTSLDKAVMVLGFNTVKNLALSVSIHALFKNRPGSPIDMNGLWLHSLGCAVAAKIISESVDKKLADDAFLFGILHDIGKIVFINAKPQDYEKILLLMREKHLEQGEAETEIMEITHQRAGSLLLDSWKFPDPIIHAVKYHHDPELKTAKIDAKQKDLIRALFLGNQMAKALHLGKSTNPVMEEIPNTVWQALNITRSEVKNIAANIQSNYKVLLQAWNMEA